jgi:hypothetical protein
MTSAGDFERIKLTPRNVLPMNGQHVIGAICSFKISGDFNLESFLVSQTGANLMIHVPKRPMLKIQLITSPQPETSSPSRQTTSPLLTTSQLDPSPISKRPS